MTNARTVLAAAALAAAALTPAAAVGSSSTVEPALHGSPQMRIIDSHHATLHFSSAPLTRTSGGGFDAKITFAGSSRQVTNLRYHGIHGKDRTYDATVTSKTAMIDHAKFTVTFRLGDLKPQTAPVKLFAEDEHS